MKRFLTVPVLVLLLGGGLQIFSQQDMREYNRAMDYLNNGGEVYFTFGIDQTSQISRLSKILSVDNVNGSVVKAYANREEFYNFLDLGLFYEVLTHPGDLLENPAMAGSPEELSREWDKYPTFEAYVEMMYQFELDYPELCRIVEIGKSGSSYKRELLYAVISDNVNEKEAEPIHNYSSTMHGDETTLYVNSLRLIDYLLSKYNSDSYVKYLVDNVEIWICPNENPDGTYQNDNSSVSGARRYTSNNKDLNRHYPNFEEGPHPDGSSSYEVECQSMLNLLDTVRFNLSANFHGGAELNNYPYDSWSRYHVDTEWMEYVYTKWADTAQEYSPSGYFMDQGDGVTNGYKWYEIHGSRMDHCTWSRFMREVTTEVSTSKLMTASQLPNYWEYQYRSLLQYIEQNLFGINGTVTCAVTDTGLKAKVFILSHDRDSTFNVCKLPHGDFWRPIYQGNYDVVFSCEGYYPDTAENVQVENDEATVLSIKLWPDNVGINNNHKIHNADIMIAPYNSKFVRITFNMNPGNIKAAIFDISGKLVKSIHSKGSADIIWDSADETGSQVANGCYVLKLSIGGQILTRNFVLSR